MRSTRLGGLFGVSGGSGLAAGATGATGPNFEVVGGSRLLPF